MVHILSILRRRGVSALESFTDIQIKCILTKEWTLKVELQEYMQNKYPFF